VRIIAGTAKGRRLATPTGSHIRPVLDQVKESIFNILYSVENLDVLDLFAGTGSIGLEAISRGAASVMFVDSDREAVKLLHENIRKCSFENQCRVIPKHINSALKMLEKSGRKFDLIFIDPPYLKDLVNPTIRQVFETGLLNDGGTIIIEHHPKEPIENLPNGLKISDERKYGQTLMTFARGDT
jgi:16S rRNA (guanine(966)-N(2))-methyltransferase RsmD